MLMQSRAATFAKPLTGNQPSVPLPTSLDDPRGFERWDPFVRYNLCMFELLGGLTFDSTTKANCAQIKIGNHAFVEINQLTAEGILSAQHKLVENWAKLREKRAEEIVLQLAPQKPFWSTIFNLQPHRHRRTQELIELTVALAAICSMRMKHALQVPRPAEFSATLQPIVPTPEHGSLPSGHATEAFAVLAVMIELIGKPTNDDERLNQMSYLAERIAENRVIAGVHYPMDSKAGYELGLAVGRYIAMRATSGKLGTAKFDPNSFAGDFLLAMPIAPNSGSEFEVLDSAILNKLWTDAKNEGWL
jgi:hypothetical protein